MTSRKEDVNVPYDKEVGFLRYATNPRTLSPSYTALDVARAQVAYYHAARIEQQRHRNPPRPGPHQCHICMFNNPQKQYSTLYGLRMHWRDKHGAK